MQLVQTPRILVLERDPVLAGSIEALLRDQCFRCVLCSAGVQALHASADDQVDLVIVDLTTIKADERTMIAAITRKHMISTILITSNVWLCQSDWHEHAIVLQKPVDAMLLLDAIEEALDDSGGNLTSLYKIESTH